MDIICSFVANQRQIFFSYGVVLVYNTALCNQQTKIADEMDLSLVSAVTAWSHYWLSFSHSSR